MKLLAFICCLFTLSCCNNDNVKSKDDSLIITPTEKPKYLWFDAEANFERFSSKDSIRYYLDKTKDTGFNRIVVDVRPIYGDVLYAKTTIMTQLTTVNGYTRNIDWDYLGFFIEEAHKRDLKVTVSTTIFPAGRPDTKEGVVYRDQQWATKTVLENTSKGMIDIKDDRSKVAAFLNPALPEVQEYALKFIREIVTNYDIDGYALDYCRYSGIEADFSQPTIDQFEKYIGEKIVNFPDDIFHWEGTTRRDGKLAKKWFEFRAKVIHDFVKKAKEEIKAIKPKVELEYWAASWYGALYAQGQNWASKKYDPSGEYSEWATPEYKNTGFAEHLDAFENGAYLERVFGKSDPESIEFSLEKGKRLLKGDCKMYGSISAYNWKDIGEATTLCLEASDGLVVFDIVHIIQFNTWNQFKKAIGDYNAKTK